MEIDICHTIYENETAGNIYGIVWILGMDNESRFTIRGGVAVVLLID